MEPGKVFVGFNVEKGILDKDIKGDGYVLKKNWFWNDFVREAGSRLEPKLVQASDALNSPVQIVIGCRTEPQRGGEFEQGDVLQFETKGPSMSSPRASGSMKYLEEASTCGGCSELAAALQKLTGPVNGYQWVDLMIGSHFEMNPVGPNDLSTAAAMLAPFRGWMRAAKA